jgi:hypothetical protein
MQEQIPPRRSRTTASRVPANAGGPDVIKASVEPTHFMAGQESELIIRIDNAGADRCTDITFKIGLPDSFLLLRGRSRIEIPELASGQSHSHQVIVRPQRAGDFAVSSPNFSYRDGYSSSVRVPGFRTRVRVVPDDLLLSSKPQLDIRIIQGDLAQNEWDVLRLRVENKSDAPLSDLTVTVSGLRVAPPGPSVSLGALDAWQGHDISFAVFPASRGRFVPVHVRTTGVDKLGRIHSQDHDLAVTVLDKVIRGVPANGGTGTDTILYIAASPTDMPPLRSDKEMREIREELQLGRYRDWFKFESRAAARYKDIGQALIDADPKVVHFSGHGQADGSLYVEDESGYRIAVAPGGIAELFGIHKKTVKCVIVNACHTMLLAQAMVEHIDHVIGMRQEVGDGAAITFSIGFYQGLAGGASVADAFQRGRAFLQSLSSDRDDHQIPVLLTKSR